MFERLDEIEKSYEELTTQMGLPEVFSDQQVYMKTAKQQRELEKIVLKYREYKSLRDEIAECLRLARSAFDRLTGRAGVEDVLDALFSRFCLGK